MNKTTLYIIIVLIIVLGIVYLIFSNKSIDMFGDGKNLTYKKIEVLMINLWLKHVTLTRMYIIATINDNLDQSFVTEKLLKNQDDIGKMFIPKHGEKIANLVSSLLREHILIAADITNIIKDKQKYGFNYETKLKASLSKWMDNANIIATDLSQLSTTSNCNVTKQKLNEMLKQHLDITGKELMSYAEGKYVDSLKYYDDALDQSIMMAIIIACLIS